MSTESMGDTIDAVIKAVRRCDLEIEPITQAAGPTWGFFVASVGERDEPLVMHIWVDDTGAQRYYCLSPWVKGVYLTLAEMLCDLATHAVKGQPMRKAE